MRLLRVNCACNTLASPPHPPPHRNPPSPRRSLSLAPSLSPKTETERTHARAEDKLPRNKNTEKIICLWPRAPRGRIYARSYNAPLLSLLAGRVAFAFLLRSVKTGARWRDRARKAASARAGSYRRSCLHDTLAARNYCPGALFERAPVPRASRKRPAKLIIALGALHADYRALRSAAGNDERGNCAGAVEGGFYDCDRSRSRSFEA